MSKFVIGDRVVVKQTAGFHSGAKGVVKYIEPSGRVWVERDGSGRDVYYYTTELMLESESLNIPKRDMNFFDYDNGPFCVYKSNTSLDIYIYSDHFLHDAGLKISGDFEDVEHKHKYAIALCKILNDLGRIEKPELYNQYIINDETGDIRFIPAMKPKV